MSSATMMPSRSPARLKARGSQTSGVDSVVVAVHASDPVTELGARSILGVDPRLTVLAGDDFTNAEVIVVVEQCVGSGLFAFLREVRATSCLKTPPRCVIVTEYFPAGTVMAAVECGMSALLRPSEAAGVALGNTVIAVRNGEANLPRWLQAGLLTQLDRMRRDVLEPHGITLFGLSMRERDTLRLLADGHDTEEIAAILNYSESTVKNVLSGLTTRYGLRNRAHAVAFAVRAGAI